MYSWIASWFTGTKETVMRVTKDVPESDWMWIEVIKEDNNQEIFIQTSEELRNQIMICSKILKKRQQRLAFENVSRLRFSKSLNFDSAFYLTQTLSPTTTDNMFKSKGIVVFSKHILPEKYFIPTLINNYIEVVEASASKYRIGNMLKVSKKNIDFEDIQKYAVVVDRAYNRWKRVYNASLLAVEWKNNILALEWNVELPKSIEWKSVTLAIECKKNMLCIEGTPQLFLKYCNNHKNGKNKYLTIGITEKVHVVPYWMQRIDVEFFQGSKKLIQKLPSWMQKINVDLFNSMQQYTIQNHCLDKTCKMQNHWLDETCKLRKEWWRTINVNEVSQSLKKLKRSLHHVPSWIRSIDVFDYLPFSTSLRSEENLLPEWMLRINIFEEESDLCFSTQNLSRSHKVGISKTTSLNDQVKSISTPESLQKISRSFSDNIIGVAMMIAAYTTLPPLRSENCIKDTKQQEAIKACHKSMESNKPIKKSWKMSIRKNKKWLKRRNTAQNIYVKKGKHCSNN
ncbi:uncharacterized protein LOC124813925 [Hydra vulgaris]|uniref:uncharacterized protein LOC124813925 n=1 Tax=Hydra vulgaris TaxID=6087 RepID=UPI000192537F|nr:uncharacterized protein LOC124813925 [Hydra vulgaris]